MTLSRLLQREFCLAMRSKQEFLNPLIFFLLVISLFPLAISPAKSILHLLAPGVIWIAALLSILISLDKLFKSDLEDGSLEQLMINQTSLILTAAMKIFCYWILCAVPLILLTPLIAVMYDLSWQTSLVIMLSLLLGTPILALLGAVGSALTVGLRNSGILLTLLILPFYIPVLIFGANSIINAMAGISYQGQLAFLAALLILAITLCPIAIAAALRISINYSS